MPFPDTEFPPGSPQAEIMGVDLALLDGDAASVVAWFVNGNVVDPEEERTLRIASIADLEIVIPHLSESGRAYFGPLLAMLRLVDLAKGSADMS